MDTMTTTEIVKAVSFNLVDGGFEFALRGGFEIALSWATCFFTYAGTHLSSKVYRLIPKKK
ncbi:MAG: hypothetical protein DRP55_07765 [Spirochaetes bacterium]|nr:MAG: hypothetical protein DRP55_07765 [Spirochaetota bacterium]